MKFKMFNGNQICLMIGDEIIYAMSVADFLLSASQPCLKLEE